MLPLAHRPDLSLGSALIRPSVRTVEGPGGSVTAEPRVMQVLLAFADANGSVLTRDDLLRACWNGQVVSDDAINRAVAEVRRIARATGAGFGIETIPRIGYRLTETPSSAASAPSGFFTGTRRWVLGGTLAAGLAAATFFWRRRTDQLAALLEKGRDALRLELNDSYQQAAGFFGQAVEVERTNATAWGLLALAHARLAESGDAAAVGRCEQALRESLKLDPAEPNAVVARALVWRGEDWSDTERQLNQALQRDSNHIPALEALAAQLQAAGYSREARELGRRILDIDQSTHHAWASIHVRKAIQHWIAGETTEAVAATGFALRNWPSHPYAWRNTLMLYAFTGEFERARVMLGKLENGAQQQALVQDWRLALDALELRTAAAIDAVDAEVRPRREMPATEKMSDVYRIMILSEVGLVDTAYGEFFHFFDMDEDRIAPAVPAKRADHNPAWRNYQWVFTPAMRNLRRDARIGQWTGKVLLDKYWSDRGDPDEGRIYTGPPDSPRT
ncbi:MAG: winged helix-turn-helix domain-containing protein [Steroidobacteraceae bacterium]